MTKIQLLIPLLVALCSLALAHADDSELDPQGIQTLNGQPIKESNNPPGCGADIAALKKQTKALADKWRKQVKDTGRLDSCTDLFNKHIESCRDERATNPYCQNEGPGGGGDQPEVGVRGTQGKEAAALTRSANCNNALSHCFKYQSNYGFPIGKMIFEQCWSGKGRPGYVPPPKNDNPTPEEATQTAADEESDKAKISAFAMDYSSAVQKAQAKCYRDVANQFEAQAKQVADAMTGTKGKPAVDCLNNDSGNRVCVYREDGSKFKEFANDTKVPTEGSSPGRSQNCSGTALGDGLTYVASGHCALSGPTQLTVYDKGGMPQQVSANCNFNSDYSTAGKPDVVVCKLNQPVQTNPVYFATLDKTVSGTDCVNQNYVLRCPESYFQNLTRQPATIWGFPAQYNEDTGKVTSVLTRTQGTLIYNPADQNLTHDILCTGGCSGAGIYVIDPAGRVVAVSANSYGWRYTNSGGAAVIPYQVLSGMRIQSVSTEKLASGANVFLQMPLR